MLDTISFHVYLRDKIVEYFLVLQKGLAKAIFPEETSIPAFKSESKSLNNQPILILLT